MSAPACYPGIAWPGHGYAMVSRWANTGGTGISGRAGGLAVLPDVENFEDINAVMSRIPEPGTAVLNLRCPRCRGSWWLPWGARRKARIHLDYKAHWLRCHDRP